MLYRLELCLTWGAVGCLLGLWGLLVGLSAR